MKSLRVAGLTGLLAIFVAACSSQASTSPSASVEPVTSTAPSVAPSTAPSSEAAAPSAEASASQDASASFELPSGDKALEDVLPDKLAGQTLQKLSMTGKDFLDSGTTGQQDFKDFLQRVGAQPDDISVAFAFSMSEQAPASIFAFQVKGADESKLASEFKAAIEKDSETKLVWNNETVGGKSVMSTTDPQNADQGKIYVYPKGDIIFFVMTPDASAADEAFSQLP